ncbi:MAG: hypothetical protein ABIO70_29350 [Pseudomonadota bacterium]
MLHLALHARDDLWLFHDWVEAQALWVRLVKAAPLHHLCLMPDHVHLLARAMDERRVRAALSGYTRWLAHHRGEPGLHLWRPVEPPVSLTNREHLERTRRYILLNPCRGRLVSDPLAWPFSTHRDALGLAWPAVRRTVSDPAGFHAYVSRDRAVTPEGTDLPVRDLVEPDFEDVVQAVSAVTRTPLARVPRPVLVRCLRTLTLLSARGIARELGCAPSSVTRVAPGRDGLAVAVERVVGDGRFPGLDGEDLRRTPAGRRYREYLVAKGCARRRDDP